MRDSLGHHAANEQNYLDIGYSESVAETRVAEWMSPIVMSVSPPVTKLPIVAAKAYGLMNRWGLFGKQAVPDMPTFGSRSLLEKHFEKHAGEFKSAFKTPDEYLIGAHDVIKNGIKVAYKYKGEIRVGYAKFMGTTEGKSIIEGINSSGVAKFEFVGTNLRGDITTYFTPSGKNFWNIINNNSLNKTIVPYEIMKLEETPQFISQFMMP